MDLCDVVAQLEDFCPSSLAEEWDNVGLLVEPWPHAQKQRRVRTALLTNDLTPGVYDEALRLAADLVVAYHPPLFRPLRRVVGSAADWQQRLLSRALADCVAVYSPHTAWDAAPAGLNDWLIGSAFAAWLDAVPARPVKASAAAASSMEGAGAGRWAPLSRPIPIADAVAAVKSALGLSAVQVAVSGTVDGATARRGVAVCAGSGASTLRDVGDRCDLLLTGEMAHHDLLWHTGQGRSVIVTGHSNCERPYLAVARTSLAERMPLVQFLLAEADRDPLVIV